MSTFQARVLYDFKAQPGTGELTVTEGEILTVLRRDVGEGWWEGRNAAGEAGLFPEAYVELLSSGPPSVPPPPLPPGFNNGGDALSPVWDQKPVTSAWDHPAGSTAYDRSASTSTPASATSPPWNSGWQAQQNSYPQEQDDDWDDDDWDDDSEAGSAAPPPSSHRGPDAESVSAKLGDGKGTVRKTFNRFSTFVKFGGEDYILGESQANISKDEHLTIIDTGEDSGGVRWDPLPQYYTCTVTQPKKESKLKGLKSYIAYQITPSFSNIAVSRRYKHFDWLHERLEVKFTFIPVPPLPDKQVTGRYESEFIEHRRSMLESWVQRVSRHPVLARSEVWRHFVSCTDDKAWKVGKRKAERDELVGAKLFLAIDAPESPLAPDTVELQVEGFGKFVHLLEKSVANLQVTALDQIKKMIRHYRREHLTVGNAFRQLGTALDNDTAHYPEKVKNALKYTGQAYEDIAKLCEDQPKTDWEPLSDKLHEYRGMLSAFPEILHLHKGALQKRREYQRLGAEGKLDKQQVDGVVRRTDIVSYAVLAEMSHFREELARDANDMMKAYLKEQIAFYRRVTEKLEDSLKQYS